MIACKFRVRIEMGAWEVRFLSAVGGSRLDDVWLVNRSRRSDHSCIMEEDHGSLSLQLFAGHHFHAIHPFTQSVTHSA